MTSAEGLAQAAAQVGYHVQTFATFPSQIMGGPTWTQTRISTSTVLSSGDELDVLVAFNREAYDTHRDDVGAGGVVIYNSGDFQLEPGGSAFGMPFDKLAKATGNPRAANMVVMGALAYLVNMPQSILEHFVVRRFTRGRPNDKEIIESNIKGLGLGRDEVAKSGFTLGELSEARQARRGADLVERQPRDSPGRRCSGAGLLRGLPHLAGHLRSSMDGA